MTSRTMPRALTLATVAAIAVLTLAGCTAKTSGSATSEPAAASSDPATSQASSTAATSAASSIAPATYDLTKQVGPDDTQSCSSVAYGQVATYLDAQGCETLSRSLFTTTAGGHRVLVSTAQLIFVNPTVTPAFVSLISGNGSGDVRSLLDTDPSIATSKGLPAKFASDPTFLAQAGTTTGEVDVLEAMWLDATPTKAGDATLTAVLKQSTTKAFPAGAAAPNSCPSIGTLSNAMSTAHVNGTLTQPATCSGDWAVAFPDSNGNEFTVLFFDVSGRWRVVNRTVPCEAKKVPATLEQPACNSN